MMTAAPFIALALILQVLALMWAAVTQNEESWAGLWFSIVMSAGSAAGALIAIWIAGGLS